MITIGKKAFVSALFFAASHVSGFAQTMNPSPSEAFSGFRDYELKALVVSEAVAADKAKVEVVRTVQTHFDRIVSPVVAGWKDKRIDEASETLMIEPLVESIKKVGGATRFFAGALAGNSYVVVTLKITAQPEGRVIAQPYFYQQAAAYGGAWTVGATDNDMLRRIASLVADYLERNYSQPVGGPTGRPN
jgi:hypothetical protein